MKVKSGDGIRKAGSLIHKGDMIARRGDRITSSGIAALAMGNEMGADVICYPIVKDVKQDLANALEKAAKTADIVIINGGSSKGGEDYNTMLLGELGELVQHGVSAVPGRPMAFAVMERKAVINLPGPNMAAYFGMNWCVRRLIEHWYHLEPWSPIMIEGILMDELPAGGPVEILHKLKICLSDQGEYLLYPLDFRRGNAAECLTANAQYVTKIFEKVHPKGSILRVEIRNCF